MKNLPILLVLYSLVLPAFAQMRLKSAKPWMGVSITQGQKGVLVRKAFPDTPAQKAGLKAGDEIVSVDNQKVFTPQELINTVASYGVGSAVTVSFYRAEKLEKIKLELVLKPEVTELFRKSMLNQPAADFNLPHVFEKGVYNKKKLKDKVVLIKFWATWCPACRSSLPHLNTFATKVKGKPIEVLAISDETPKALKAFFQKAPNFKVLSDKNGEIATKYNVSALPTIFVIDKKGIIRHAVIGAGLYLEEAMKKAEELAK